MIHKTEFVWPLDHLPARVTVVKTDGLHISGVLTVEEGDRLTLTVDEPQPGSRPESAPEAAETAASAPGETGV